MKSGTSNPRTSDPNATINPTLTYDQTGSTGAVRVSGLNLSGPITLLHLGGTTNGGGNPDNTAAGSCSCREPSRATPVNDTPAGPTLIGELIGALAEYQGMVLQAFVAGPGGSFTAPAGVTRLLLGIADAYFAHTVGSYEIAVVGTETLRLVSRRLRTHPRRCHAARRPHG